MEQFNVNQVMQKTKTDMKSFVAHYQKNNLVPNFVLESALKDVLLDLKDLQMQELIQELQSNEENKPNGNIKEETI